MRRVFRAFGGGALGVAALLLLTATPGSAQIVETAFTGEVQLLADTAGELLADAEAVNLAWETREINFQQALADLRGIEDDAANLLAAATALEAPASMAADRDQVIAAVTDISTNASAMVAGLRASDSGEARQAALAAFGESVRNFETLAAELASVTAPTTTVTVAPATTEPSTTSTTEPAPTTTTSTTSTVPLRAVAVEDTGGSSGAPWPLVPIALAGGLVIGLFGGLVLGRQARTKLIEALRAARAKAGGSPPT